MLDELPFKRIVAIDFEFNFGGHDSPEAASRSGERPRPVCMVAKELRSGQTWRLWQDQFGSQPPFPLDDDTVLVAYYASAELGCFKALGWPQPKYVLDLFTEFRARTNGMQNGRQPGECGRAFRSRCHHRRRRSDDMISADLARRPVVCRGASRDLWTTAKAMCECWSSLLLAMLPRIDLPRALLRGRFMKAAAAIEWNGTPIDTVTLELLRQHWTGHSGRADCRDRCRLWGVRRPQFPAGTLGAMACPGRHPLAHARKRPARSIRRDVSGNGEGLSESVADARVAQRPVGNASL